MTTSPAAWPKSLVLAGAGRMGSALLRGWLREGLAPSAVHVIDPNLDPSMSAYCREAGVGLDAPANPPEALDLAVKPQTFATAPGAFALLARPETLVVSILAGKTLAALRAALPHAGAIVRAMPNLPASIGCGISGVAGEPSLSAAHRTVAHRLLAAAGQVEWLDERFIDAVTAVSGSGPAYVFYLVECLAAAGIAAGLAPDVAERLARVTVEGSGALMERQRDQTAAALREAVTSPGGTTAAALKVLRAEDGLEGLLVRAIAAAAQRASDLSR